MDDDPGEREERFGHYALMRELGRGGQGAVWLAKDMRLGRRVALKLLHTAPGSLSHQQLARFRREAEAASRLDHPNICGLLDAGNVDGVPYLAFRYVSGKTLAQQIAEAVRRRNDRGGDSGEGGSSTDPGSREGVREVVAIFEKLARALHQAHEAGLIHRDVKPSNVMVTEEGEPVILDFGLAREELGGEGLSLTQSGDLLGTPAYMSPEQLMAHRVPLDRRTDVYSLGASMYQALTLRMPHQALTRAQLYQMILHADPPSANGLNRQIQRDLQVVLETAMEKDRDRRYQTSLDLAEDLRRCRELEPIRARPIGWFLRAKRWIQRHPTATVAFGLLSAGMMASLLALARIREQLRTRTALNRVAESRQLFGVDPVAALKLALEAYELRPGVVETVSQLHWIFGQGLPIASYREAGWEREIGTWSGDGSRLLQVDVRPGESVGSVTCGDADLANMTPRFANSAIEGFNCGFSSSGSYVYGVDDGGLLHVWNEDLRRSVEVDHSTEVEVVHALAGLDQLVVLSPAAELGLIDLGSGKSLPLPADLPAVSTDVVAASGGPTFAVGLVDATLAVISSNALVSRSGPLASAATRVAYAEETGRVVGVLPDGSAVIWALATGSIQLLPDCDGTLDAQFSRDGRRLLTLHEGGVARLRDEEGAMLEVLERPDGSRSSLRIFNFDINDKAVPRYFSNSTSKPRICIMYQDLATSIYDLSGRHVGTLRGMPGFSTNWADWSADGRLLILSQGPPAARVFDPDGTLIARLAPTLRASASPDGHKVFLRGRLWALPDPDLPRILAHGGIVRELAADRASGRIVATGSDDTTCRVWSRSPGPFEQRCEFRVGNRVLAVDVDRSGDLVLYGCYDGAVALRRLSDSAVLFEQRGTAPPGVGGDEVVSSVALAPDGRKFAVSGQGRTDVYDVRSGQRLFSVSGSGFGVQLTERHLIVAMGGLARLFTVDGQPLTDFDPSQWCNDARLSPSEDIAACASGAEIWIYERQSSGEWPERPSAVLRGHNSGVWCVRFDPRGDRILSASNDGTARIWSIPKRRELAVLEGHEGPVRSCAFVDGGERVLTTGADGTIRTWFVDEDDLLQNAQRRWEAVRR